MDGIPGGAYKALETWMAQPLKTRISKIHHGGALPPDWENETTIHIYKQKGAISESQNYRPICLTQIAYKIWPILHAKN